MTRIIIEYYNHFVDDFGYIPSVNDICKYASVRGLRIDGDFIQDVAEKKNLTLSNSDNYRV